MVASEVIGGFLQGGTKDEINRSADQLLRLAGHFEQSSSGNRRRVVERHQEIHIAPRTGLAARRRAKNLQPADAVLSAKRTEPSPQLISELCLRSFPHSGRIASLRVYFKALCRRHSRVSWGPSQAGGS